MKICTVPTNLGGSSPPLSFVFILDAVLYFLLYCLVGSHFQHHLLDGETFLFCFQETLARTLLSNTVRMMEKHLKLKINWADYNIRCRLTANENTISQMTMVVLVGHIIL